MKTWWRERLTARKAELEGGEPLPDVDLRLVAAATVPAVALGAGDQRSR